MAAKGRVGFQGIEAESDAHLGDWAPTGRKRGSQRGLGPIEQEKWGREEQGPSEMGKTVDPLHKVGCEKEDSSKMLPGKRAHSWGLRQLLETKESCCGWGVSRALTPVWVSVLSGAWLAIT